MEVSSLTIFVRIKNIIHILYPYLIVKGIPIMYKTNLTISSIIFESIWGNIFCLPKKYPLKIEEIEDFNGVAANGDEFYFEDEVKVKLITVHCEGIFSLNGVETIPYMEVLKLISGDVIFKDKDFWLILNCRDSDGNDYAANLRNGIVISLKNKHSHVYNLTNAVQLKVMEGDWLTNEIYNSSK